MDDETRIQALEAEAEVVDDKLEAIGVQINQLLAKQEKLKEKKDEILKKIEILKDKSLQQDKEVDWSSDSFPWSTELKNVLNKTFKLSDFRPLQKETMNVVLSKKDCILIMPTGGGKSLSFQLPALILHGFTLVISPLVSLMEDQLITLHKLSINAMMLSASTGTAHNSEVLSKMIAKSTDLKILYVTPERLAKSKQFMSKLDKAYSMGNIGMIVIDEVHCASTSGHDYRPDYKMLCILKRQYPKVPLLGLTATASEKVLDNIKDILGLGKSLVFRAPFNRPNLFYKVLRNPHDQEAHMSGMAARIQFYFYGQSGIVYCFSRKDSEEVAAGLRSYKIKALCYHAELPADVKSNRHEEWINGSIQVIVATDAFGMGIDKPDVRFVFHHSISKSIENYYQETGRAGHNDQRSHCFLFLRFQDVWRQAAMVFTENILDYKTGLQYLHNMLSFALDRRTCRRTLLGKFFGEQWQASDCNKRCDNCQPNRYPLFQRPLNSEAQELVDILESATLREERLTPVKLIDTWLGKCKVKDRPEEICQLPRRECEDIVMILLLNQVLREDFHFTPCCTIVYILPGPRWPHLKHGKIEVFYDGDARRKRVDTERIKTELTTPVIKKETTEDTVVCIKEEPDEEDERKEIMNVDSDVKPSIKDTDSDTERIKTELTMPHIKKGTTEDTVVCIKEAPDEEDERKEIMIIDSDVKPSIKSDENNPKKSDDASDTNDVESPSKGKKRKYMLVIDTGV